MTQPDQFNELAESWATLNRAIAKLLVTQPSKMTAASEAVEAARARHESLFMLYTRTALSTPVPVSAAESATALNAGRYEHVRKMSAWAFTELYEKNLRTGVPFDTLVDELREAVAAHRAAAPALLGMHPPLGSDAWFKLFGGDVEKRARQYVNTKTPVNVFESTDAGPAQWVVAFAFTDFWADAFEEKATADQYAAAWLKKCQE